MYDQEFSRLIDAKQPTGEVIAVDQFIITVRGLTPVGVNAQILFENGVNGLVSGIEGGQVTVFNMSADEVEIGMVAIVKNDILQVPVGPQLLGRVVSPLGRIMDEKAAMTPKAHWPVFSDAPSLMQRQLLDEQLETGITVVDVLFPIVLGQRIAVIGDSKTGKTSFLLQLAANQTGKQRIVIYVIISKTPIEINAVVTRLTSDGSLAHTIVVATSVFDPLVESYLAPYIACAMAEYFWYGGQDVVILYDDLTSHAQIYREISLMSGASPGRESYPGEMFFRHASLLERAGKLASNGKTLTAVPVVLTPNNDITAYLPTNIISITDGQLIFDSTIFKEGRRPSINIGLSVSRVGGRAQTDHQKSIRAAVSHYLNDYSSALEFSHFATELAPKSKQDLAMGTAIHQALSQTMTELFPMGSQQVLLDSLLQSKDVSQVNIESLKQHVNKVSPSLDGPIVDPADYNEAVKQAMADSQGQS